MFLALVDPPAVQNFWAPVSQIVPVFALGLVIESRQIARRWKSTERAIRWVQAAWFLAAGLILWTIEVTALTSMASDTSTQLAVWLAVLGLCAVILAMCLLPVQTIALAGGIEALLLIRRLLPNSEWRKARKLVAELETLQVELNDGVIRNSELSDTLAAYVEKIIGKVKADVDNPATYGHLSEMLRETLGRWKLLSPAEAADSTPLSRDELLAYAKRMRKYVKRDRRETDNLALAAQARMDGLAKWREKVKLTHFDEESMALIESALSSTSRQAEDSRSE